MRRGHAACSGSGGGAVRPRQVADTAGKIVTLWAAELRDETWYMPVDNSMARPKPPGATSMWCLVVMPIAQWDVIQVLGEHMSIGYIAYNGICDG